MAAADSASAAFGPVIGGVLVRTGWQAIWLVDVPVALAGIALAPALLPKVPPTAAAPGRGTVAGRDLPGIAAFVLAMGGLIGFLLSAAAPEWPLPPLAGAGAAHGAPSSAARPVAADRRASRPATRGRVLDTGASGHVAAVRPHPAFTGGHGHDQRRLPGSRRSSPAGASPMTTPPKPPVRTEHPRAPSGAG
ncbi:hypothetical protein [Marinitenerispora sediminis]|uniref:Major facilitator superfamily (MFS) profile domain-containing protein n=1 Tax=Marinitenerispora sediminis TaxID=1931232 RepID=A0A368T7W0_9ACTN|nr:hypothetical protein [Marinitenerispora sediminis]RCV51080.1 hypothetical protein DEF28_16295 [Marinitenerispora sediminis]RCV56577.1 hypothetical protein DEF23_12330 [Marinitenerispora sediminis]RCV60075.1 hypothetical protein DEF24_07950 [Marinitenerispora sediminis]